jgi:hypothetical protein
MSDITIDWRATRCGHNYEATECKAPACVARDALRQVTDLKMENANLREHVASLEHAYKDSRKRIREMKRRVMFGARDWTHDSKC